MLGFGQDWDIYIAALLTIHQYLLLHELIFYYLVKFYFAIYQNSILQNSILQYTDM